MEKNMKAALKPCPFCGYALRESNSAVYLITNREPVTKHCDYKVKYPFCDCCSNRQWSKKDAIGAWNRRACDGKTDRLSVGNVGV